MKNLDNLKISKPMVVIASAIILMVLCIVMIIALFQEGVSRLSEMPQGVNEIILENKTMELRSESIEESLATNDIVVETDPYELIYNDIENIKAGDANTITRYFGSSEVFSPDIVSDKLAATMVSFISSETKEDGTIEVLIHICALDYDLMVNDTNSLRMASEDGQMDEDVIKKEIAKGIVRGDYDVHYTIPVVVSNNTVKVTEELKQVITGNWYNGLNIVLTQVDCPLAG